jgi:hypothetical protein
MSETLHWDSLPVTTRQALDVLNALPFPADFYLAGGTALALQIGHRISQDLDFFSSSNPLDFGARAALLKRLQSCNPTLRSESDAMLYLTVMGVEVSFIFQHHPLINPPQRWESIALADPVDIGLMKLAAVKDRGARRDFIDLYCLRKVASLAMLFALIPRKYSDRPDFALHLAIGLRYFDDAENDPRELLMRQPVRWRDVKKYCEAGARLLTKRNIGLVPKGM